MTSQYGAYALRAGFAWLYARMRMHMPSRPVPTWQHKGSRTHARTHARTHRPICNIYCFSTATMIR
jgi:hypothetical protein